MVAVNWRPEEAAAGAAAGAGGPGQQQEQPHLVPHASSSRHSLSAAQAAQLLQPDTRCYLPITWRAECQVAEKLAQLAAGWTPPTAEQASK
jgi:hypothetical protein